MVLSNSGTVAAVQNWRLMIPKVDDNQKADCRISCWERAREEGLCAEDNSCRPGRLSFRGIDEGKYRTCLKGIADQCELRDGREQDGPGRRVIYFQQLDKYRRPTHISSSRPARRTGTWRREHVQPQLRSRPQTPLFSAIIYSKRLLGDLYTAHNFILHMQTRERTWPAPEWPQMTSSSSCSFRRRRELFMLCSVCPLDLKHHRHGRVSCTPHELMILQCLPSHK
jgi:hypothetical protein